MIEYLSIEIKLYMKHYLIIPLGGLGIRFLNNGYKTYKPFLKTSNKSKKNFQSFDS